VRRLAIALVALAAGLGVLALGGARPAGAQTAGGAAAPLGVVEVIEATGLLDEVVADDIATTLDRTATDGTAAVILRLDTTRAVVPAARVADLARRIATSPIPVAIWVGPSSGSRAEGLPGQLVGVAAASGMAPGSRIGNFGPPLDVPGVTFDFGTAADRLRTQTLSDGEARAQGVVRTPTGRDTPTIGDFLVALNGLQYHGTVLTTAREIDKDGQPRLEPAVAARFVKLDLLPRLMHTVASPPVAYLLLVIGLCLLVFELYTAGVGVAGVTGAACIVLGGYGVFALPVRGWALVLLLASIVAFAVDVQTGVPRVWTGIGVVLFVIASVFLFDGLRVGWIPLGVGIVGVLLTFLTGMPSMVRTRFATPTIGREWMIGREGIAVQGVAPDGVVRVGEGTWRARTNRATPIKAGDVVRVVAVDGLTLEVEPEQGGAQDYRERARARGRARRED
jgi:membrane-bound serine protease (ClpP class)